MAADLYLTLPSNTKDFKSNTTAEFRVKLPHELRLAGEWEMGLVEIQYPYSWNNVKEGDEEQGNWILISTRDKGVLEVSLPAGSYRTIDELIAALYESLESFENEVPDLQEMFKLSYHSIQKRVRLKLDPKVIRGVVLGKNLQYMFGFGGDWSRAFTAPSNTAEYPPDLTAGFNTLYIYCNLVQPQIVGDKLVPLLRTVPIEGEYGQSVDRVFLAPHYLPLRNKAFDTVEISIKDDTNQPVEFGFGKALVKVHLKQKQP